MNAISGDKTFLGHSLGTMVIARAAQHHAMGNKYLCLLNSAIATECFDERDATGELGMWHDEWRNPIFKTSSLASNWYTLFDVTDMRSKLTWNRLFVSIAGKVHNFYSSTEDVLEHNTQDVGLRFAWSVGTSRPKGAGSWVFQEKTKGSSVLEQGTSYGGWGFNLKDPLDPSDPVYWGTMKVNVTPGYLLREEFRRYFLGAAHINGISDSIFRRHPAFEPGWGVVGEKTRLVVSTPVDGAPAWIQDLYDPLTGNAWAGIDSCKHQLLAEMLPALTSARFFV
jgi:hypothetical protein